MSFFLKTILNNVTKVLFVPTNSIFVLTTVIDVEFTDIVSNINYVCDWYQNNHKLITLVCIEIRTPKNLIDSQIFFSILKDTF